jgi:hypothetical protein
MDTNGEEEGTGRAHAGDGQPSLLNDGQEGRGRAGEVDIEEAPERDSAGGGRGQVGQGFVYFIETEDGEFVKIGYSARPYQRLSQLGTLRPGAFALRVIGWIPGTYRTERWLHAKFSTDRDNGEWFRNSMRLRAFIAAIGLVEPEPPKPPHPPKAVIAPKPPKQPEHADAAAAALAQKRWDNTSQKKRSEHARKMNEARWEGHEAKRPASSRKPSKRKAAK